MKKIMVVEDNDEIRSLVASVLEQKGFEVIHAHSGRAAEKLLADQECDLVLTDNRMNDGDGIELLEWVRERDPVTPPVMMMTAYADFGIAEALARGARELLTKPVKMTDLLNAVKMHLVPDEEKFRQKTVGQNNVTLNYKSREFADSSETLQWGHGGCFIGSMTALRPGSTMEFAMVFEKEEERWSGSARIRWTRSHVHQRFLIGYGMEFLRLDEPMRSWFLERRKENPTAEFIPVGFSKSPI